MYQCKYKLPLITILSLFVINSMMLFFAGNMETNELVISLIFMVLSISLFVLLYLIRKNQNKLLLALDKQKEQFKLAIKGTKAGLWDWNLVTNQVYYAPEWKLLLGYKDHELTNEYATWRELVYPDEVVPTEEKIAKAIAEQKKMYEVTFRMKHKDGHWVWILSRAQTIYDENGQATRMIGFHTDISRRQEALLALQESEKKFHSLFHDSPDVHISISTQDARVLLCNNTFLKTLGYEKEEVIGHPMYNLYHKESQEKVKNLFKNFQKTGIVNNEALTAKRKDGTPMPILLNVRGVRDKDGTLIHANGTWKDITEMKKAEKALKSSVSQIRSIFRSAPIGIGLIKDRVIQEVNDTICHICGYSKEEMIGKNSRIFYVNDEAYQKAGAKFYGEIDTYGVSSIETQLVRKNGNIIDVLLSISPLDPTDHSLGFTFTVMDITEEKRKDELMIVQSRHAAMGEMIGMIAHQWRQPLSIISMGANNILLDIALEKFQQNTVETFAEDVLKHTKHLSKTIDDFRNFFKPDKALSKVKIPALINETYEMLSDNLENHQIAFKTTFYTDVEIDSYPREVMQVFVNIINNAKDALLENHTKDPLIQVDVYEDANHIMIDISDNGSGIPEDIIKHIFDPYFTTKNDKNGTGLGLYMSKTIIENHLQGKLKVSNKNAGACFTIRLPREQKNDR